MTCGLLVESHLLIQLDHPPPYTDFFTLYTTSPDVLLCCCNHFYSH